MATTLTTTTFATTYKDDYADSDQYYRILFNAGRALQARELTQMQTIIQEEMARFGRNIFLEGAAVKPGGITTATRDFIKLDTATNPLPTNPQDLVGLELTVKAPNPAIKVKVLEVIEATGSDPATLYVKYTDTTAASGGSDPIIVPNGALLENGTLLNDLKSASSLASGAGLRVSCASGEFFVQGHFVFVAEQSFYLSKYTPDPSGIIGFKIVQEVVTIDDTDTLYDNQGAAPNIAAPGADRYRIRLVLTSQANVTADDNFVYVAKVSGGAVVAQQSRTDGYNAIYDLLAVRTKEESGNYTLNNFTAKFNDIEGNDSNLDLEISRGIAYVDGYRLEMPPTKLRVSKARDTVSKNNQAIIAQYGNYVIGNTADNKGLPNIDNFDKIDLTDAFNYANNVIGTARCRAIEEADSAHKFYLFDIQMNSGRNFRDVKSFGNDSNDYVNIVMEDGIAQLKSTSNNSLLFDLPSTRPTITGVSDLSITVQKRYTFTYSGTTVTLTAPSANDIFTNTGDWVLATTTGVVVAGTYNLTGSPTGNQVQVSGIANGTYELVTYVALDGANISVRTKTLEAAQNNTISWPTAADSDGLGLKWIDLGYSDVYEVQRVRTVDSDGLDLLTNFTFDNGQRDNFYAKSRLIAKPGVTIPTGDIYYKFRRFSHGAGDLFAVNSYNGAVSYENIPSHTKSNGEVISLRDVLDFRPVQGTNGEYDGTGGIVNALPQTTDVIRADVEYYLPRKDKLAVVVKDTQTLTRTGSFVVLNGVSALEPLEPNLTTGLSLYNITLKPYTLDKNDAELEFISNKRYTMKDIGKIEKKIDNLTELTTLSLLENNTATLNVLDSAGNTRTKAGFLADNFTNYSFSDTFNPSYRAKIDQGANELTPTFIQNNVRLIYDSDDVSNTVTRVGDYLIAPYTETTFINQNLASGILTINPFGVITTTGRLKLSPSSDEWFETAYTPDIVIDKGDLTDVNGSVTVNSRNDHRYSWYGTNGEYVITGTEVVRELINEKVLEKKFIPYMRSIKVYFQADGLRPNTQHFAFFNNVSVSNWVREESSYANYSTSVTDYGNTLKNATAHPDGATNLISDANGTIIGSFVIPSTDAIKFRCGSVIFKLLDISTEDDNLATSSAFVNFIATGIINVTERTFESTRHIDLARPVYRSDNSGGDNGGGDDGGRSSSYGSSGGGYGQDTSDGAHDGSRGSDTSGPF